MSNALIGGTDALGIRKVYEELIRLRTLKTIFRPSNPKYEQLYQVGSIVELRIIDQPGSDTDNKLPIYTQDQYWVKITRLRKLGIRDLMDIDFANSSPDVKNIVQLTYHLGMIYNKCAGEFRFNDRIVKIDFEYYDKSYIKELNNKDE